MSLQLARMTSVAIIKMSATSCTLIELTNPPALSKACGKFKRPAPKVAFTIRKIVLNMLVPANITNN